MTPRTLDNTTQASIQGRLQVTHEEYLRYKNAPVPRRRSEFPSHLPPFRFGARGYQVPQWDRFSEHFMFGDTNPAKVIDASSGLVASYTDLDNQGKSRFHVIKFFVERLSLIPEGVRNGDTFAAISLYEGGPNSRFTGKWSNFFPIVANCVSRNKASCDAAKAKIPASHWAALDMGLTLLGPKTEPGLYDIGLPNELKAQL